ncbi:MAG: heme exporter protein CcmB [Bacteroidota bacterium]
MLRKELTLEWKQKYALSGILLYVCSTVFVVYLASSEMNASVWNSFFWVIVIFAAVNAIAKSFIQESGSRQLYYYQLVSPYAVVVSKIIYNTLVLWLLSGLAYLMFALFHPSPVEYGGKFLLAILLGGLGFSVTLTFVAAIAARASNGSTLTAILGFPILLPILVAIISISRNALVLRMGSIQGSINMLVAIDLLLLAAALALFPYLWRD